MVVLMGFNAFGTTLQSLWIMFFARKDFPCGVRNRMQDKILSRQLRFSPFSSARYFDICLRRFLSEDFKHRSFGRGFENIYTIATPGRRKSKLYQQSTNADQKSIETVFSIAICRQCGDKWQSKTLFLTIFDLRSSIVLASSIAAYLV